MSEEKSGNETVPAENTPGAAEKGVFKIKCDKDKVTLQLFLRTFLNDWNCDNLLEEAIDSSIKDEDLPMIKYKKFKKIIRRVKPFGMIEFDQTNREFKITDLTKISKSRKNSYVIKNPNELCNKENMKKAAKMLVRKLVTCLVEEYSRINPVSFMNSHDLSNYILIVKFDPRIRPFECIELINNDPKATLEDSVFSAKVAKPVPRDMLRKEEGVKEDKIVPTTKDEEKENDDEEKEKIVNDNDEVVLPKDDIVPITKNKNNFLSSNHTVVSNAEKRQKKEVVPPMRTPSFQQLDQKKLQRQTFQNAWGKKERPQQKFTYNPKQSVKDTSKNNAKAITEYDIDQDPETE